LKGREADDEAMFETRTVASLTGPYG
jgi:hypothetical protein